MIELSDKQRAVVDFVAHGSGHGLVCACAGGGKTSALVAAVTALPATQHILCTAFNARIRDRLQVLVPPHVTVRTVHQLGRDTLRAYPNFRRFVHDDDKAKLIAAAVLEGTTYVEAVVRAEGGSKRAAMARFVEIRNAIMQGMMLVKATLTTVRADLLTLIANHDLNVLDDPNEMAGFIADGVRRSLTAWPHTDFDDEVWLPVHYGLGLHAFDHVLVDEAQDLTRVQFQLVLSTLREGGRLTAIGDERQTIYTFRGADPTIFKYVRDTLHATVLPLSVSYRCPKRVVRHVQTYVPEIEAHPEAPEGRVTQLTWGELYETVAPGDFVLSRTNAALAAVGLKLAVQGVPVRTLNAHDICQSLVSLARRSRKRTVSALLEWLETYVAAEVTRLPLRAFDQLEDRVSTLRTFLTDPAMSVADAVEQIEHHFADQLERHRGKQVILSTVHRLKGEEAPRVFLLEGTFFSPRGDETEEENLYYVAATRAQRTLFLVGQRRG